MPQQYLILRPLGAAGLDYHETSGNSSGSNAHSPQGRREAPGPHPSEPVWGDMPASCCVNGPTMLLSSIDISIPGMHWSCTCQTARPTVSFRWLASWTRWIAGSKGGHSLYGIASSAPHFFCLWTLSLQWAQDTCPLGLPATCQMGQPRKTGGKKTAPMPPIMLANGVLLSSIGGS